jgi:chromate reductase, NAD(P)H dehydrogenase (quinone)
LKPIILALSGSINPNSANRHIINYLSKISKDTFIWRSPRLVELLPWFSTEIEISQSLSVQNWYKQINEADLILFSTPEYVFSLPGILKNALEWLVSTMLLDKKPVVLITAAANGEMAHASLKKIVETMGAIIVPDASLLIQGAKGKIGSNGRVSDSKTEDDLNAVIKKIGDYLKHPHK